MIVFLDRQFSRLLLIFSENMLAGQRLLCVAWMDGGLVSVSALLPSRHGCLRAAVLLFLLLMGHWTDA